MSESLLCQRSSYQNTCTLLSHFQTVNGTHSILKTRGLGWMQANVPYHTALQYHDLFCLFVSFWLVIQKHLRILGQTLNQIQPSWAWCFMMQRTPLSFPAVSGKGKHSLFSTLVRACSIAQSCPTLFLCDPMDHSPPGSSAHEFCGQES